MHSKINGVGFLSGWVFPDSNNFNRCYRKQWLQTLEEDCHTVVAKHFQWQSVNNYMLQFTLSSLVCSLTEEAPIISQAIIKYLK